MSVPEQPAPGQSPAGQAAPPRQRLLATGAGTNLDAFAPAEWGLLAVIATIWGSSFVLMEIALGSLAPAVVGMLRVGLGAGALALVPRARRAVIEREDLPRIALLGITWVGVPQLLFPIAQQWIDSSVAGMINGAMPLTTAAWAALLLRRLPGRTQAIGLLIGFAGIVAISLPEFPTAVGSSSATTQTALGAGLVFTAIILYGLSANLAVPLSQRYGSLPVLFRAQLAALVVIAPFGLVGLGSSTFAWGPVLAMLPLGILGTGLAFVLMATLVGRVGAPRGAIAIYFVPVVAIALGVLALGERVHPLALAGTGLVLVGAWITSRREAPTRPSLPGPERIT